MVVSPLPPHMKCDPARGGTPDKCMCIYMYVYMHVDTQFSHFPGSSPGGPKVLSTGAI